MTKFNPLLVAAAMVLAHLPFSRAATAQVMSASGWITLGTQGGPIPTATRSQPANALIAADGAITLVDVGDGAVEQLARAGLDLRRVNAVFLSHLHFDHTAGMLGVLGLRYQLRLEQPIHVYGPPGTKAFVAGLVESLRPFGEGGFGIIGEKFPDPADGIIVTELLSSERANVGDMAVTVTQNSHYSFPPGSDLDKRFKSLSYRFDTPGRSFVFTGDTGPSDAVTALAQGADVLVSEMIDVNRTVDLVGRIRSDWDVKVRSEMEDHQRRHHIEPAEIGKMAARAGVKMIVLTHFAPGDIAGGRITAVDEARYRQQIAQYYKGEVAFAKDLDRF